MSIEEIGQITHKVIGKRVPGIKALNLLIHADCSSEETEKVRKLFYRVIDIEYLGIIHGESYELWVHMENGDMPVFYSPTAIKKH